MRTRCIIQKVRTPFGSMYVFVESRWGRATGGHIEHPGKNPDAQVEILLEALSAGFDAAMADAGKGWWRRLFARRVKQASMCPEVVESDGFYMTRFREDS